MMHRVLIAIAALGVLGACGQTTPPSETPAGEPPSAMPQNAAEATAQDTCGASAYQSFVGQNVAAVTVPEGVRTIGPDTMVTQDFRPERLNMIIDSEGRILRFECY